IDGDSQGLKRPRGGIDAADAHGPDGAHDGSPQIQRRPELVVAEGALDAPRDPARAALVAVAVDYVRQVIVRAVRDQLERPLAAATACASRSNAITRAPAAACKIASV